MYLFLLIKIHNIQTRCYSILVFFLSQWLTWWADLFLSLANLFFSLANLLLVKSLVILVVNLFLTGFLSLGQDSFERLNNFHVLLCSIAPISSFISSHHVMRGRTMKQNKTQVCK